MTRILVLGAGLVARPLVKYLLAQDGFQVTVADRLIQRAEALIGDAHNGRAVELCVGEGGLLEELIVAHDLVVSLLPAQLHPMVAGVCVELGRSMVTTSYVSPVMAGLDGAARARGLTILNEAGVDPGLDHMSAMRVIDDVHRRGGRVLRFRSYCGGVPAPDSNDNPWGYKMSWSPRGVCMAANSSARFARRGIVQNLAGALMYSQPDRLVVDGFPCFQAYPNRDSLRYAELYGMQNVETMYRGTLRYEGWCESIGAALRLNLFDDRPLELPPGATWAQFMAGRTGGDPNAPIGTAEIRRRVARAALLKEADPVLERFAWLGLFDETPARAGLERHPAPVDYVSHAMSERMSYAAGERDAVVMKHFFRAVFEERNIAEHITCTLVVLGEPGGESAMSRTVGLPAAVAARLIAGGIVSLPGVRIPVDACFYEPILDELAGLGIRFLETRQIEPL